MDAAGPSSAAVDLDHLGRFTLGNRSLEAEVLEMFANHIDVYLERLACAETDKAWSEAAHTLKGASWAIGAWRLGMLADNAERLLAGADAVSARSKARTDIAAAAAVVEAFIRDRLAATRAA